MFKHLMVKATRNLVSKQMDRPTEDIVGYNDASIDTDHANYCEIVPANRLQCRLFAKPIGWRTW